MKTKISMLIDAGYMREVLKDKNIFVNEVAISNIVKQSIDDETEILHKVLYYDCTSYKDKSKIDTNERTFRNDELLDTLSRKERFAVRLGKLKCVGKNKKGEPILVQKGVDIRIALDVAKIIMAHKIHRIILIAGDTDLIPAMKMARIHDIEVGLIRMSYLAEELYSHMDFMRNIDLDKLVKKKILTVYKPKNSM